MALSAGAVEYPPNNECPGYNIKQSSEILELWGMWSTNLLPSLQGPLWLGLVAPDRVVFMC